MLERFTWFKQSAFRWDGDGLAVYIDPWGITDPVPADVVFITHAHYDHFDLEDIARIRREDTRFVVPRDVAAALTGDVTAVGPGDEIEVAGIRGHAVPAYNVAPARRRAHPKENGWVGYVLELGDHVYYHAGDTDHLPELEEVRGDAAFLPICGDPFTMSPREAAELAGAISPQVAVPMHYGFESGSARQGEEFRVAADPVRVEILMPRVPFDLP